MRDTKKVKSFVAALGMGLALASGSAAAQVTYFSPITVFEDQDLDFLINLTGGTTTLDIGDRLVAPLEVFSTAPQFGGGASVPVAPELTGIADVTVLTKNCVGTICTYTFGPTAGGTFANVDANGGTPGAGLGTMVAFWTTVPNLDLVGPNCISLANCTALATDGPLYFSAGFAGDVNEIWQATSLLGDDTAGLATQPATTLVGTINYGLSFFVNNTGQIFGLQPCGALTCTPGGDNLIQILGSGTLNGGLGLSNGAFARSDFDFQVAPLPEPGSLLLLSAVLGALGFASRRKKIAA